MKATSQSLGNVPSFLYSLIQSNQSHVTQSEILVYK